MDPRGTLDVEHLPAAKRSFDEYRYIGAGLVRDRVDAGPLSHPHHQGWAVVYRIVDILGRPRPGIVTSL